MKINFFFITIPFPFGTELFYNYLYKSLFTLFEIGSAIYIFTMLYLIYLLINKFINISNIINNNKLNTKFGKELFEAFLFKYIASAISPTVILLIKCFYSLQFVHFSLVSISLLIILLILSSEYFIYSFFRFYNFIFDATKFTIHAAPMVVSAISYGLLLKGYMKYVQNRPFDTSLNGELLSVEKKIRSRNLAFFSLIGAPALIYLLRTNSPLFKNIVDVSVLGSGTEVEFNSNRNIVNNGLFLFISKINSRIPSWLKLSFKLLILVLVVLKLLGFSIIFDFLINIYLLKNLIYFLCSIVIGYQLLNLYLIHKFSIKKLKYSEVLPDFIINWLKEFEVITSSESGIKRFKQICYIEICIYLFIMVVIGLIF